MQRTPEPELMLTEEQARAYAEADFEEPHSSFVDQLVGRCPDLPRVASALDAGCGACDITRRVASRFPEWRIDAIDGSPAMLRYAAQTLARFNLEDRVNVYLKHLPQQPPPNPQYDVIFSNSLLHHLATPAALWGGLRQWGRPGASVLVMDLHRPTNAQEAEALERYAEGEPRVLQDDFHNSLLAAYTLDEVRDQLDEFRLSHFQVEAISDRHWVAWGTL
jgi:trans-aconitate methyltransferase